jgi:hypothetical protein
MRIRGVFGMPLTRYPWVEQKHGNGFTDADVPLFWDLVFHLRTDIPIKTDDYMLGMLLRGPLSNSEKRVSRVRISGWP